jgi:hypothetical protein
MTVEALEPHLGLLSEEYVLVQAWKKTAAYIRYHNWFSDTLELDRVAVNLPDFLEELSEQLREPAEWSNDPLRIVPAPKSQAWRVRRDPLVWEPVGPVKKTVKLRPLAHVSLKDQVAATAVMLCLADRVETLQGNVRRPIDEAEPGRRVISYGNRLFCDAMPDRRLRHRWGAAKLYRTYSQDYRSFLDRPETFAEAAPSRDDSRVIIVHSDLRHFYDRVSPDLLAAKMRGLHQPSDDADFLTLAVRLLNWQWDRRDTQEVSRYAAQAGLGHFSRIALPQGLVAAGFFANLVLLDFDRGLRDAIRSEIAPGMFVEDASRYVDDLRIVLNVARDHSLLEVEGQIARWLQELLDRHAQGLEVSREKTKAAAYRGDERPLVRQSRKMARIQGAISGGFDAIGGEEILDAVQGLIRTQQQYKAEDRDESGWSFSPIPDVRDSTVARFGAARFRTTFRSLRPLLADREEADGELQEISEEDGPRATRIRRTQADLDDEARAFALGLIERWIEDPSNVRLLRIGLDLWPADDVLSGILNLLRRFTETGGPRGPRCRVAWYCMAELFRAGATETGFVEDDESLPSEIDIDAYRAVLRREAVRLAAMPPSRLPWYLRQQVLLYLAANAPHEAPVVRTGRIAETRQYRELIRFLRGECDGLTGADFATLAILARRSYLGREAAVRLTAEATTPHRLATIAGRDPAFALEILAARPDLSANTPPRVRDDLCLARGSESEEWASLAAIVLEGGARCGLRNEIAILRLASRFLEAVEGAEELGATTPSDVLLKTKDAGLYGLEIQDLRIKPTRVSEQGSLYSPPDWCQTDEAWRFRLGYLLRFILSAREDFTRSVRPPHWRESEPGYRAPQSHWYQRLYGFFNGQSAFGDDWLPISEWVEELLFALLSWPGCRRAEFHEVESGIQATRAAIERRLRELEERQGPTRSVLMLPQRIPRPDGSTAVRPLRACVVQSVIPTSDDYLAGHKAGDLTLSSRGIRRRHRRHLSAALAAVERMLDLRETHKGHEGRLDWLILPELAVHPLDVGTHLVPFARRHKAIVLAGLTYEELFQAAPLVNSALWVIPVWSAAHGLQILTRRQGKHHLAPEEEKLNTGGAVVQGFRPCQWLMGYDWSPKAADAPLWLTASICYDATDLALASDLRYQSDVFAIPAMNKDVGTFDQMAQALHYHMFQYVIVGNNGTYGGSNSYVPLRESYERQVFHLHGQPQASLAFFEIDDIRGFQRRKADPKSYKFPPAGL